MLLLGRRKEGGNRKEGGAALEGGAVALCVLVSAALSRPVSVVVCVRVCVPGEGGGGLCILSLSLSPAV